MRHLIFLQIRLLFQNDENIEMFSLYELANLIIDNSYGQDISRGVVSRPKSGRVGGRVGMVHPDLSKKSGRVGMAYPDLHHFRGKLGKVEDNPDSAPTFEPKVGESWDIPIFPDFRLKSRVKSGLCLDLSRLLSKKFEEIGQKYRVNFRDGLSDPTRSDLSRPCLIDNRK